MFARISNRRIEAARRRTFLGRLAGDSRGNTLALVAAAIIPLTAMTGSAIDLGRTYMASARLQQACDAASLAGRRVMTTGTVDDTVKNEALKFFNFNFPQGTYGTAAFTPAITAGTNSTVIITASTTIPTTVMKLFGFSSLPLSTDCTATQNFVNTDIVLVLDNTGSMNCTPDDDGSGGDCGGTERTGSKMAGMRSAVLALYDALASAQTQLTTNGLRLRYGIVPYSGTVNVGLMTGFSQSYLKDSNTYQSRVANYNTLETTTTSNTQTYGSNISSSNCNSYGANQPFSGFNPNPSGSTVVTGTTPTATTTTYAYKSWSGGGGSNTGTCKRTQTITTQTGHYVFTSWTSGPTSYDVSQFKTGSSVTIATDNKGWVTTPGSYNALQLAVAAAGTGVGTTTVTWSGCIEERQTVTTINSSSGFNIPTNAFDLNIDLMPTSAAARWAPYWPDIEYTSKTNQPSTACPAAAKPLQTWTREDLQTYIAGLKAVGGTYTDVGMIWGGRLLSSNGIFASSNPATYNNMPVNKYIILMTDGYISASQSFYHAYGVENLDHRTTTTPYPGTTTDTANHAQRFSMACNAIRGQNVSIWVVAFGNGVTGGLDPTLQGCASNPNQAAAVADTNSLIAKFTQIGNTIGALRLSQ